MEQQHTYGLMREFADSWALLALFVIFLMVIFWAFRPGGSKQQEAAAESIFRNEERPAPLKSEKESL